MITEDPTTNAKPELAPVAAPTYTAENLANELKSMGFSTYKDIERADEQKLLKVRKLIRERVRQYPTVFSKHGTVDHDGALNLNMNSLVPFLLPAPDEVGMLGTGVSTHKAEPFQLPESWRADGGFIPLSSDASVAVGNTHENGGIKIGDNVVENNETLLKKDGNVRVYSDRLGYSDEAKKLSVEKGLLEKEMEKIDGKLNDLFQHQESSKEYAAGGKFPVPDEFPINGTPEEQRAWMGDYPDDKNTIPKTTPEPVSFSEKVKADANSKALSSLVDAAKDYSYKEPVKVVPKPTYHEQLLSLVEELKPKPDKKQETNLKRAAKYQALADFVNVLGDSFYGAKGAKIKQRDPNVTGSLKALQDYYDKLASGEAAYRNTKMGLLSKLADKADAQDALAGERAYQEGRDKLKADAEEERFNIKLAADKDALVKKIDAARELAKKRLAAQKKAEKPETDKRFEIIVGGKVNKLTNAQVGDVVSQFLNKYRNKLLKNELPKEQVAIIDNLLSSGTMNNPQAQVAFIDQFAKTDQEMADLINRYGGQSTQPSNTKTTTSFTPDFSIPGSNEAYVSPGQVAMSEEELQSKLDNLDFNL